ETARGNPRYSAAVGVRRKNQRSMCTSVARRAFTAYIRKGRYDEATAMNELQTYMVHEYVADYKAGFLSRRDLVRRVLNITGGLGTTATLLLALGCSAPAAAPTTAPAPTSAPAKPTAAAAA